MADSKMTRVYPQEPYAIADAVWLFESEVDLLKRYRAAKPYDSDGTHYQSRVCQDCGWEVPVKQRDLTACPGCSGGNMEAAYVRT